MDRHGSFITMVAITVAILFVGAVCSWIWNGLCSLLRRKPAPEIPDEEAQKWEAINAEVAQARRRPDGTHERGRIVWESCDAPVGQGPLIIHNRKDPEHVKQCKECREGLKPRYSGVSHRSN